MIDDQETLLLPFFTVLRRYLPLGVSEYLIALDALKTGYGLDNPEDLWFTCRLIWAKSQDDQEIFDREFVRMVLPVIYPRDRESSEQQDDTASNAEMQDASSSDKQATLEYEQEGEPESVVRREEKLPLVIPAEQGASEGGPWSVGRYQLQPRLPISRRDLASIWRHLRRLRREGMPIDLDVEGTISSICQNGYFLRPVLQPRRRNQMQLLVLIDRSQSMVPFAYITQALIESMHRGGLHGQIHLKWIGNDPNIIEETTNIHSTRLVPVLHEHHPNEMATLIISDAGAARGEYSLERVKSTRRFLLSLHEHTYRYVWINPLPRMRWEFSSAEEIARMVPMYPITREDLLSAVDILRGRPFPPEVQIHGTC